MVLAHHGACAPWCAPWLLRPHDDERTRSAGPAQEGTALGVVLLDLVMPVMNGWELVAVMTEDSALSGIPVIITSGSEPAPTRGVIKVFKKPLDMELLLNLLHTLFPDGP